MIKISNSLFISDSEYQWTAIRAQGKGGQNVNKVSSAIHLRFDIRASSLPDAYKERLLTLRDQRITREGVVVIKAQSLRTQEQNLAQAIERLTQLIQSITLVAKVRKATRPTQGAKRRRLEGKKRQGELKRLRRSVDD